MEKEQSHVDSGIEQASNRLLEISSKSADEPVKRYGPSPGEVDRLLKEGNFPARHRSALSTMYGPGLEKAVQFRGDVVRGDSLLLLVGDHGPGKTQMATWWAAERAKAEKSVGYYRKTIDMIGEIKATWAGGKAGQSESEVARRYKRCGYLVLDEFQDRGDGDWEAKTLVNILDHRYDAMLVTVLIANIAVGEVKARIASSIVSRAEETGCLIYCDWPSYRQGIQEGEA